MNGQYEKPVVEIIELDEVDILATASSKVLEDGWNDGGIEDGGIW